MPIYSPTGYLDITNATLRTSNTECENLRIGTGNIYVTTELDSNVILDLESVTILGNTTSNTIQLSHPTTGILSSGNIHALKFIGDGSLLSGVSDNTGNISNIEINLEDNSHRIEVLGIELANFTTANTIDITNNTTAITTTGNVEASKFIGDGSLLTGISSNLDQVLSFGNVTTSTLEILNDTLGLVTTGNVEAAKFIGDGSSLTGISSNLDQVLTFGNVASNTMHLTNPTKSLVTSGDVEVGGMISIGTVNLVARHTLSAVTNTGNTTSTTIILENPDTSLVASGNVEVDKNVLVERDIIVNGDAEIHSNLKVTGYVKTGNPAFYVYRTTPGVAHGSYIVYDASHVNLGNNMNILSGVFTCPVAGIYTFTWGAKGNFTDTIFKYYIHKNNIQINDVHLRLDSTSTGANYGDGERTVMLNLSENDMISIFYTDSTNESVNDYGYEYTYFQGYLISYT
jgi:hypothetical protein